MDIKKWIDEEIERISIAMKTALANANAQSGALQILQKLRADLEKEEQKTS